MIPKTRPDLRLKDLLSVLRPRITRREFEEAVATRCGAQYCLAFTYAHAGFYALLKALNLTQAEIILPAYTCDIMPKVIVATGNIPVFVDIDLADYNMSLGALKSAITSETRAIVATHMFGYPSNIEAIRELADDERIVLVEDAALMFPGSTSGSDGLQSDVALFSFGPGKPLFTVRGGVMVTDNSSLYEKLKLYRDNEMNQLPHKQWAKRWTLLMIHYSLSKGPLFDLAGRMNLSKTTVQSLATHWRSAKGNHHSTSSSLPADYATRYADFQARIGLTQLRKSDLILSRRRALARLYDETLSDIPGLTPAPILDGASYSLYSVRVKDRDAIRFSQHMQSKGVEIGCTFNYALPNLDEYQSYVHGYYPCADQTSREVVNLPSYLDLSDKQAHHIGESVRHVLKARY